MNAAGFTGSWDRLTARLERYREPSEGRVWFDRNYRRVERLFSEGALRDFVFEPIKGVFSLTGTDQDAQIRSVITRVAVANAVMAGLPGKMGVGVAVSMALEGWMAYAIAQKVGVRMERPADVWKYVSLLGAVSLTIVFGFKALLGFGFSAFSVIPGVNPLIPAELVVTNLVGVLFWIGFQEAADTGSFTVPKRAAMRAWKEALDLGIYQWAILRRSLNPANLGTMGVRLRMWLTGELAVEPPVLRGDVVTPLAMVWLLAGQPEKLDGPLGQEFLGAIRERLPDLADAPVADIAEHMAAYDEAAMVGVLNLVKGRLFERLVERYENADGDEWTAELHEDQSHPGSDIVFTNAETGEQLEVSLKATLDPGYIESSLLRYPEYPIFTTEEVAEHFTDGHAVFATPFEAAELERVTAENFDAMLDRLPAADVAGGAAVGAASAGMLRLWSFVAAYARARISYEQLESAFTRVSGETGRSLAARCGYAILFGPVFAWYLLARGTMGIVRAVEGGPPLRRLVHIGASPVALARQQERPA